MTGPSAWSATVSVIFRDGKTTADMTLKPSGPASWADCFTYEDRAPILTLRLAGSTVTVYPPDVHAVTAQDVAAARELNDAAAMYLAEVLRLERENPRGASAA